MRYSARARGDAPGATLRLTTRVASSERREREHGHSDFTGTSNRSLVVLLRGLNVGGHRNFKPSDLARELSHLGAVNIGAAGTFVFRQPIARTRLREEIARRLPFDAEIVICEGREIVELLSTPVFARCPVRPDVVRFVSVLSRRPVSSTRLPLTFPARGMWLLKVLARDGRFVLGVYRRHMKVIGFLGGLDRLFGVPATTRNWNTLRGIARALE